MIGYGWTVSVNILMLPAINQSFSGKLYVYWRYVEMWNWLSCRWAISNHSFTNPHQQYINIFLVTHSPVFYQWYLGGRCEESGLRSYRRTSDFQSRTAWPPQALFYVILSSEAICNMELVWPIIKAKCGTMVTCQVISNDSILLIDISKSVSICPIGRPVIQFPELIYLQALLK